MKAVLSPLLPLLAFSALVTLFSHPVFAQNADPVGVIDHGPLPEDLNGSNFTYPWPVKLYRFTSQHQTLEMAFMDIPPSSTAPSSSCGAGNSSSSRDNTNATKTAILFHGKNFCGPTWYQTAGNLTQAGYRVILPDAVGFCKSSKPQQYQFSLQQLALNAYGLLAALDIDGPVTVIGHSLGGMLAIRFGLMYPSSVADLVLVDPIGLEDWKAVGVPYLAIDDIYVTEHASNYTSIRAYEQMTYYVNTWAPAYDVWVNMLVNIYKGSEGAQYAYDQALVTDMVLTQPVVYELPLLTPRTLLVVGDKDTTAIGSAWSPPAVQAKLGHYEVLGKQAAAAIPNCTLVEFADLGHAPQIQDPAAFHAALFAWLS